MIKLVLLLFAIVPALSASIFPTGERRGENAPEANSTTNGLTLETVLLPEFNIVSLAYKLSSPEERQNIIDVIRASMDFTVSEEKRFENVYSVLEKSHPLHPAILVFQANADELKATIEEMDPSFDEKKMNRAFDFMLRDEFLLAEDDERKKLFMEIMKGIEKEETHDPTPIVIHVDQKILEEYAKYKAAFGGATPATAEKNSESDDVKQQLEDILYAQMDLISKSFKLMSPDQRRDDKELTRVTMNFTLSQEMRQEKIASLLELQNPEFPEPIIQNQAELMADIGTMIEDAISQVDPHFDKKQTVQLIDILLRDEFILAEDRDKKALFKKMVKEVEELEKKSRITPKMRTTGIDGEILKFYQWKRPSVNMHEEVQDDEVVNGSRLYNLLSVVILAFTLYLDF